jgi:hypothetical protein
LLVFETMSRDRNVSRDWSEEDDGRLSSGAAGASHIMNGETRFPTAMSYLSDAQRSDVATVCSGSVTEDIFEVESVLSQEDQVLLHNHSDSGSHHPSPTSSTIRADRTTALWRRTGHRVAEFVNAPRMEHDEARTIPGKATTELPPVAPWQGYETALAAFHKMGPPLSRALLIQRGYETSSKAESVKSAGSHTGSEGAHDCGNSVDVETHSVHSQEDTTNPLDSGTQVQLTTAERSRPVAKENHSRSESVKSFGSRAGSEIACLLDTDDCGGSLDVETHSVETRSNHSQEDGATLWSKRNNTEESSPNPLLLDSYSSSGRRSPGGTIYKGRGERRYVGRYMHLPLKRFHNNGVHLESMQNGGDLSERDGATQQTNIVGYRNGFENGDGGRVYDSRRHGKYDRRDIYARRNGETSRSRSRSPSDRRLSSERRANESHDTDKSK